MPEFTPGLGPYRCGVLLASLALAACTPMKTSSSQVTGTTWRLIELEGKPVEKRELPGAAHLVFDAAESRVSGSSGCNRVMGGYTQEGDQLRFAQLAGTMMACMEGMELEGQFLRALPGVERWHVVGSNLDLLGADGKAIARFEASAAP